MQTTYKTLFTCGVILATTAAAIAPDMAVAQSYGGYSSPSSDADNLGIFRILLVLGLGGLGLAVGWFFSPKAKDLRRVLGVGAAALFALFIAFDGSMLSWALSWGAGYIAFFAGLGYWAKRLLKDVLKTPTTFGSAQWATPAYLKAHGVFAAQPAAAQADGAKPLVNQALSVSNRNVAATLAKLTDGKPSNHWSHKLAAKIEDGLHTPQPISKRMGVDPPTLRVLQESNATAPTAQTFVQKPNPTAANPLSGVPDPLSGVPDKTGLRLGLAFDGEQDAPFYYRGDRHLLTVAPTRSGKGTTQIVPNLLTFEGSALVIDPKGENARITARERKAMGHDVFIVDPWAIAVTGDQEPARFNPLDWLVIGDADITENAMLLADALIVQSDHKEAFWTEEAKALLHGVILYVATDPNEDGQRHLGRVRDLMLLDGEELKAFFTLMLASPHHVVASTGARCLQKEERLLANVLASAQAQTHFLDSPRMRESLSASDFDFADLKARPMTIYLVLPSDRLNAFSRWMRLLVQQAITVNARNIAVQPKQPVLFLLDEMPTLGRLAMIEQAYGLMAGFGMQLWSIVQDVGQLKRIYGDGWETFVGNSGVIQYFGSHDSMTANYFSDLCGVTTVWSLSTAISTAIGTGAGSSSRTVTESDTHAAAQRKLIYPDELMRLHHSKQLVFIENLNPIQAKRVPWFEDKVLKHKGVNLHHPSHPSGVLSGVPALQMIAS